ncbi:MAG TPA: hypothetical protein VFN11_17800 [Ktedonobacterales bacterium]|nr:hypothetical protein [Ktedonobacterales bacterium]
MADQKITRESFADEASWLEYQHNNAEMARHERARKATQQYAAQGRDYDIIKRINKRIKWRKQKQREYLRNPEQVRQRHRPYGRRYYERHADILNANARERRKENWEWVRYLEKRSYLKHREERLAHQRAMYTVHAADPEWYEDYLEYQREYMRKWRAEHREEINASARERRARKKAEKLAAQQAQRFDGQQAS